MSVAIELQELCLLYIDVKIRIRKANTV